MSSPILKVENLTKRFGSVVANNGINIDVMPGEILCLFGENGAGKSTLSACITGFLSPDSGRIIYQGETVRFATAADAIRAGIGMVHQHFVLIPEFTVLENIIVGAQQEGIWLQMDAAEERVQKICDLYHIDMPLHAYVRDLSVGEQQWVELLKALFLDASLLILDEPTATLAPEEAKQLFNIIKKMREDGLSIVLISHKLEEVMQSHRVTVLRKGEVIGTVNTPETTPAELTRMMVGREVSLTSEKTEMELGQTCLSLRNVSVRGARDQLELQNVTLEVRSREILGIAGVAGNGQNALMESIAGVRPVESGEITLDGEKLDEKNVRQIMAIGVGHIPDDRFLEGLVPQLAIEENMILGNHRDDQFTSGPFMHRNNIRQFADEKMASFQIDAPGREIAVENLSGGNAQRVILAREMQQATKLLLANQPTRGLDVGVIEYVYQQLLAKRAEGCAIVFASAELEDLFQICDRIAVLSKGSVMGVVDAKHATIEEVGLMMTGHRIADNANANEALPT